MRQNKKVTCRIFEDADLGELRSDLQEITFKLLDGELSNEDFRDFPLDRFFLLSELRDYFLLSLYLLEEFWYCISFVLDN